MTRYLIGHTAEPTTGNRTGAPRTTRPGSDRGSATVWAVGAIAVLLSVAAFGLHLGAAMVARHQAEAAADLAALAGAGSVTGRQGAACEQAHRVADRMRVRLVSCLVQGWDVAVEVVARPGGGAALLGDATGRARAGPAP